MHWERVPKLLHMRVYSAEALVSELAEEGCRVMMITRVIAARAQPKHPSSAFGVLSRIQTSVVRASRVMEGVRNPHVRVDMPVVRRCISGRKHTWTLTTWVAVARKGG